MRFFTSLVIAFFGFLIGTAGVARAQTGRVAVELKPLSDSEPTKQGARTKLALRVVLPEGMHVQSNAPKDPALIPTALTIEPQDGIEIEEIIYPAPTELKQEGQSQPLSVFGREFMIGVRVKVGAKAEVGEWVVKGQLRYQACNDKACYPPATAPIEWTIWVERGAPTTQHGDPFGQVSRPARFIRVAAAAPAAEPLPTPRTLVAMTRSAMNEDPSRAEQMVKAYRAAHGVTPEMLLALSWLGRGALAERKLDAAERYARETYDLGRIELKRRGMDDEGIFPIAFGAAIEVLGDVAAERGQRSEAVAFLNGELKTYGHTSLYKRIQKNINSLSLEGTVAPPLDLSEYQGVTPPTIASLKGRVVLLFFWAHWCGDCKAQGPVLDKLLQRYTAQGFTVVAPTQRFGYVAGGANAPAEVETSYIAQVREKSYPWMAQVPVTLNETNHKRYGVSTTPTLVLVDRAGLVRLYNPGHMTETDLEPLIRRLLEEKQPVRVGSAGL